MSTVPANRHLEWVEVRDFTPGLWESGDWLIPPGGAQVLTDAYPQPGGGLRAFFKPAIALAATGIGANERIIGLYGHGTPHRTLPTEAVDFYCVTYSSADFRPRIYRWDQSDAAETQWRLMATLAAATGGNNAPKEAHFSAYVLTAGTVRILASIGYVGTDSGIWAANQSATGATQAWAKIASSSGLGPMTVHQSRIVEARGSVVHYTGPGNETWAGSVNIEPQRNLADVKALLPMAPGDLVAGTDGTTWAAIQGDITAPSVRSMSSGHSLGTYDQTVADTGEGLAFMEPGGGIFLTDGGNSFTRLDTQLKPPVPLGGGMVSMGDLVFHRTFLVVPGGYVWDQRTKAWFRVSEFSGASPAMVAVGERRNDLVYVALAGTTTIYSIGLSEASGQRANSYTWKSPTLRHGSGRQTEVREVQVVVKSHVGTSSVTVTVNGTPRTVSNITAGRHTVSFLFRERAEVLDVTVAPSSGDTTTEAPSIEVIRIGHRGGHLVR